VRNWVTVAESGIGFRARPTRSPRTNSDLNNAYLLGNPPIGNS
jgi:hypothetical protein